MEDFFIRIILILKQQKSTNAGMKDRYHVLRWSRYRMYSYEHAELIYHLNFFLVINLGFANRIILGLFFEKRKNGKNADLDQNVFSPTES